MKTFLISLGAVVVLAGCSGRQSDGAASQSAPLVPETVAPFTLSTTGSCPAFHCEPEGTGLMRHLMPAASHGTLSARNLLASPPACGGDGGLACDVPGYQSCSSDDTRVVCLFLAGADSALAFDVSSQPGPSTTFRLLPMSSDDPMSAQLTKVFDQKSGTGVVPLIGDDHSIIVADGNWVKRLRADGTQIWPTGSPDGAGNVGAVLGMESSKKKHRSVTGLTPLEYQGNTVVAVTFDDYTLSKDLSFTNVVVFDTLDGHVIAQYPPQNGDSSTNGLRVGPAAHAVAYHTASPPVAHGSSLYFAGYNKYAVPSGALAKFDLASGGLTMSASQTFGGAIPTGASPMVVDATRYPAFPADQVLLHVPAMTGTVADMGCPMMGAPATGDHLVSFKPDLSGCNWASALNPNGDPTRTSPIQVGPALDPVNGGVWVWTTNLVEATGQTLYHYPAAGGAYDRSIDLPNVCTAAKANCGQTPSFAGHIFAVNPPGTQKVYITGFVAGSFGVGDAKSVIAIDTTPGLADADVIHWLAPIGDLGTLGYGSAIPMVTLPGDAGPGLIFAGGVFTNAMGDVSLVGP